jgi:hypothetical protein
LRNSNGGNGARRWGGATRVRKRVTTRPGVGSRSTSGRRPPS